MAKDVYASRFWTKWYSDRASQKLVYPPISVASFFDRAIKKYPDRIALYNMDTSITFRELDSYANKFANFLIKSGLKKGDVVGINTLNSYPYYIAFLGIQKAGCIYTGVNPLQTPDELEYQLNDCGAKALLTVDLFWGNVKQIISKTKVKTVAIAGLFDLLPTATEIPKNLLQEVSGIAITRFTDVLKDMQDKEVLVKTDLGAICWIQYTGGTTGRSKGATLTNKNVVNYLVQWGAWINAQLDKEEVLLTPFPMFIGAGMLNNLICLGHATTQVIITNPRDMDYLVKSIKAHKPNQLTGVPTIWLQLIKRPDLGSADFSNTRICCSGAAPFPAEYLDQFEKLVGKGKLMEAFGLTETLLVIGTPSKKYKLGSIGVPLPDIDIKIVDPATRQPLPLGEVGEIAARGPDMFMTGYFNKPEETAKIMQGGWLYTGDAGRMDEDGFVFIMDRLKDMVNVSGYKVFTLELDDVIMKHPDVDLAASVGIPDPKRPGSERVATAIVLQKAVAKSEEEKEKLLAYIKEKVAAYKVPKVIEFMDALPVSSAGKILKRELRESLGKKLDQ